MGHHVVRASRAVIVLRIGCGFENFRSMKRPESLEELSLLQVCTLYNMKKDTTTDKIMFNHRGVGKEAVVRWIPVLSPLDGNDYFRQQILLNQPFRSIEYPLMNTK